MLIEANLRTRTLAPSEVAKCIAKLYELKGVKRGNNQHKSGSEPSSVPSIAKEMDMTDRQVRTYASIGKNLIPEWMELFGHKDIDIKKAYALS